MQYQTKLSAGLDLCSTHDITLPPFGRGVVDTGVYLRDVLPAPLALSVAFPLEPRERYCDVPFAMVCSRSGLAANCGVIVLNAPGIIDVDYEQTIKVILYNTNPAPLEVPKSTRIAQLVFAYAYRRPELVKDEVRQGGLGSTGG